MINSASGFSHCDNSYLGILNEAYSLLIFAYKKLISEEYDSNDKNENKIRDDLVNIAQREEKILMFEWDTESRNLQKENRMDITLITANSLKCGFEKRLGIECKVIKNGCAYIDTNRSNSRSNSPTNGLMSYVSCKYSKDMPLAGMIGFIKNGDIDEKITIIKKRVADHTDIHTTQNLRYYKINSEFFYSYKSEHQRDHNIPISIYHLFFNFNPN